MARFLTNRDRAPKVCVLCNCAIFRRAPLHSTLTLCRKDLSGLCAILSVLRISKKFFRQKSIAIAQTAPKSLQRKAKVLCNGCAICFRKLHTPTVEQMAQNGRDAMGHVGRIGG